MSDIHELQVTVDLRDGLSGQELAELRWHLGLGPEPEQLTVITEFPFVVVDDDGNPRIENEPRALLAGSGPAWKVGGTLGSSLTARTGLPGGGWSLTSRTELHPDDTEQVGELLRWLAPRVHDTHVHPDGTVRLGHCRWYEDPEPYSLEVRDGQLNLP
ncbi:hypothetical protein [Streptomyces sp. NPDC048603]|uniref:hypothetical protein n=1 Tax=Streptomyces sp. NPDC048603 TaxID=3365577 RepID=UPI00371DF7F6